MRSSAVMGLGREAKLIDAGAAWVDSPASCGSSSRRREQRHGRERGMSAARPIGDTVYQTRGSKRSNELGGRALRTGCRCTSATPRPARKWSPAAPTAAQPNPARSLRRSTAQTPALAGVFNRIPSQCPARPSAPRRRCWERPATARSSHGRSGTAPRRRGRARSLGPRPRRPRTAARCGCRRHPRGSPPRRVDTRPAATARAA